MTGYTKLFNSIVGSTIWREDLATKVVWVTMMAMADRDGVVEASVPGLAHFSGVSIDEAETAVGKFLSPDPYSRTPEHEGRRVEPVDGGWRLLNHEKYRFKMSKEDIREQNRLRQKRRRDRKATTCHVPSVTERDGRNVSRESRDTEAYTDTEDKDQNPSAHPLNEPGKVISSDVRLSKAKIPVLATAIYVEYPRKVGKAVALKAIEKSILAISKRGPTDHQENFEGDMNQAADWLKARTVLYAKSPEGQRTDKEHIPHPTTWFGQERYDDDSGEWSHVGGIGIQTQAGSHTSIAVRSAIDRHRDNMAAEAQR